MAAASDPVGADGRGTQDGDRPAKTFGEGDCFLVENLLAEKERGRVFAALISEIPWAIMHHRGEAVPRRISIQYSPQPDGSIPVLRFPNDELPPMTAMSPIVNEIRVAAESALGGQPLNHVLVQHYRDGNDHITEHSDKTLDIKKGTKIANVSFGAMRIMTLRTKRKPRTVKGQASARTTNTIPLSDGSLLVMGLSTNAKWLHSIRPNKKLESLQHPDELAYAGARVSITFRTAATFLSANQSQIYGQGASSKIAETARNVNPDTSGEEAVRMLHSFGAENQQAEFDWNMHYGEGFNVINVKVA